MPLNPQIEELPDVEEDLFVEDPADFGPEEEPEEDDLDPQSKEFLGKITDRVLLFLEEMCQVELFPYQRDICRRIILSVLSGDGATITVLVSRQAGKSEAVADCVSTLMVLLPLLAKAYPELLGKFKNGLMVGSFAPSEMQAETLFSRLVSRLTSEHAMDILLDDEIDDVPQASGKLIKLKRSGSFCRMQTANPKAKIESKSYQLILVDEAQDVDDFTCTKSIFPMGAFYNATKVLIGTPSMQKGIFHKTIQANKRSKPKNHLEFDWRHCARYNKDYAKYVKEEIRLHGEDSDVIQISYYIKWLLDRGMFVSDSVMEEMADPSMTIVRAWHQTPVLVGIDPARAKDSTVVTVLWVDWDYPDEFGLYECRILNWLEITNEDWESQYFEIANFLAPYNLGAIAVDAQGMGGPVAERLQVLFPNVEVHALGSDMAAQSKRWKHLTQLLQRRMLGWPGHSKSKRLRTWKRFDQQMRDLEKNYHGQFMLAEAPSDINAHDDYCDSLALAVYLTSPEMGVIVPEVEVSASPFFGGRNR